MTLVAAGDCEPASLRRVQLDTDWLIRAQNRNPDNLSANGGWAATKSSQAVDGTHTCYAVMGLYSATLWGIPIPGEVWRRAATWYCNNLDFSSDRNVVDAGNRWVVDAGLRCLAAAAWASLKIIRLVVDDLELIPAVDTLEKSAVKWLEDNYMVALEPDFPDSWYYFYLFNLTRGCVTFPVNTHICGQDWYDELADSLLMLQKPDGQWSSEADTKSSNVIHTSFALLALSKAQIVPTAKAPDRSALNLGDEGTPRRRKKLSVSRRIRRARFPVFKTLDEFNFDRLSEIDPVLFRRLENCDFVTNTENIVLIGNSGLGKTHLAIALGISACNKGYKVRFCQAFRLVNQLVAAHMHRKSAQLIERLSRIDLLIIDELSYFELSPLQAELLFQVLSSRYERASTIVTTNLGLSQWAKIWGNSAITDVVVGRLRAVSYLINLNGP